jgi:hypothetical protein
MVKRGGSINCSDPSQWQRLEDTACPDVGMDRAMAGQTNAIDTTQQARERTSRAGATRDWALGAGGGALKGRRRRGHTGRALRWW